MRDNSQLALKLRAYDAADIEIISAHLQDSVLQIGEMAYLARQNQFALMVNRYKWECTSKRLRVRCAIQIHNVLSVRQAAIQQTDKTAILSLLAVSTSPQAPAALSLEVMLYFSGGGKIGLTVEAYRVIMEDVGAPWATRQKPQHETQKPQNSDKTNDT